jgi:pyruvate/2-oxoglutarate dehydrogenase complex dihydrolipoamide dehydrogenase (E3) component
MMAANLSKLEVAGGPASSYHDSLIAGDPYDGQLLENVHPPDWANPTPTGKYNLVVIGAGTAGLVSAAGAAGLGAKVALIERSLLGGDCLNYGCVPSKGVIRAARAVYDARESAEYGVRFNDPPEADFAAAMERMRRLRARISPNDSAERFKKLGVDVYLGDARFVGPSTVEVDGRRLEFDRAVIAAGARAASLPIPGLQEAGWHTNETIFTLTELPRRLVVIGAGPIGCELAQTFQRFGSRVTVINDVHQIMPREDPDAAGIVRRQMEREGINLIFGAKIHKVEKLRGEKLIALSQANHEETAICDAILLGVGRTPNVDGLELESAGVKYSRDGVEVNDRLQTTNPRIYAAGDVCSRYKFTHAADAMARIVLANAFFFGRRKASALVMPWCTYTDPEVAHVGYDEADARKAGYEVATITQELADNDRAILEGETEGFARVHYDRKSGRILGGTIVARHAGEMVGQLTLAITTGQKMSALASMIQPYPTQAEVIKRIGDAYMREKLTPGVKKLFSRWFAWRRR